MSADSDHGEKSISPIRLNWLPQASDLRDLEDDWSGITDPVKRRKLQNRLNQRNRRIRAQKKKSKSTQPVSPVSNDVAKVGSEASQPNPFEPDESGTCLALHPRVQALMKRFADHAYNSYIQGAPAPSHLPLLVKLNVANALARNAEMLGVTAEFYDWNGISPLNKQGPMLGLSSPHFLAGLPVNMHPTQLQISIEHHPWIDLFPWPRLRDNLLQAFKHPDICDEDDLCRHVCDYVCPEWDPALIVWGAPWEPSSWEVSDEFIRKWAWLLSGCFEIIEATNHWRAKRGERLITEEMLTNAIQASMPRRIMQPGDNTIMGRQPAAVEKSS